MKAQTLLKLNRINQEFYQKFALSFSQTRQKIQPGVSAILDQISPSGNWLDIGCGNGNLAYEWVNKGYKGLYYGVDFSPGLITDAKRTVHSKNTDQEIVFTLADLNNDRWLENIPLKSWDGIFCFAVLHHIPGEIQRQQLCTQIRQILNTGKIFYISVWQPLNTQRLVERIHSCDIVGISKNDVESGDVLIDWRANKLKMENNPVLRYVHIFNEEELNRLATSSGFSIKDSYSSDGKEGNLGLYQHWMTDFL